jgi:hypothetical protein
VCCSHCSPPLPAGIAGVRGLYLWIDRETAFLNLAPGSELRLERTHNLLDQSRVRLPAISRGQGAALGGELNLSGLVRILVEDLARDRAAAGSSHGVEQVDRGVTRISLHGEVSQAAVVGWAGRTGDVQVHRADRVSTTIDPPLSGESCGDRIEDALGGRSVQICRSIRGRSIAGDRHGQRRYVRRSSYLTVTFDLDNGNAQSRLAGDSFSAESRPNGNHAESDQ